MVTRKIVNIDEEKCDGCGLCIPACSEGALRIVDGKARIVKEIYCDGLGDCLGHCPRGAISIEEREAPAFDEKATKEHLEAVAGEQSPLPISPGGCPSAAAFTIERDKTVTGHTATGAPSELRQWPVQLALVPPVAPFWENADLLIAADCVPFAYADFHADLLRGKALINACPKLDETGPYPEKLISIFSENNIRSVTVARMEVPCCSGLVRLVREAIGASGKEVPFHEVEISIKGEKK
ncbi:MAG: 4Fe-4S binding protein [Candidatus Tritonobacter lacicola]|nr:4Fe-4S binding protein [Candidatus Tritonobacter lacicola]